MYPHLNIGDVTVRPACRWMDNAIRLTSPWRWQKGARQLGAPWLRTSKSPPSTGPQTGLQGSCPGQTEHSRAELKRTMLSTAAVCGDASAAWVYASPLHACEHFFIVTEAIEGLSRLPRAPGA